MAVLTSAILARSLGPSGRGELALALAVAALALAVANAGQSERLAAELRSNRDAAVSRRISVILVGSLLVTVGTIFMGPLFGLSRTHAALACIWIGPLALLYTRRSVLVAEGRPRRLAYERALGSLIRFSVLVSLFFASSVKVNSAILITQGAMLVAGIVVLGVRRGGSQIAEPDPQRLWTLFLDGLPILMFAMLTAVTLRADVIVLAHVSGIRQVGLYAAAVGITEGALAVSAAFKARMQAALYSDEPWHHIRGYLRLLVLMGVLGAALTAALSEQIVGTILGPDFHDASGVLQIMGVSAAFQMLLDAGQGY